MKNKLIKEKSWLRALFPLVRFARRLAWKFHDRMGVRLVVCGGSVQFMDTYLTFPEKVGLNYSTLLFWNGADSYEAPTSRTIAALAGRSQVFLDIGSNIGIYAVYVGVKYREVQIFAFEPEPAIYAKNCAFHRTNSLSDKNVLNIALSDDDGVQKLFMPVFENATEEEQTATLNPISWQANEKAVTIKEVQCLTLDTFAKTNKIASGNCCMKIDVENHETAVLMGAKNFILNAGLGLFARCFLVKNIIPRLKLSTITTVRRCALLMSWVMRRLPSRLRVIFACKKRTLPARETLKIFFLFHRRKSLRKFYTLNSQASKTISADRFFIQNNLRLLVAKSRLHRLAVRRTRVVMGRRSSIAGKCRSG